MSLEHPESLENVSALEITQELKDFTAKLATEVEYHKTQRATWETRLDDWFAKRYGIRQRKTFPWRDAANFVLPLIDSDINRLKPAYVNLAYGVSPIVVYEPFGAEDIEPAKKREMLFDWRLKNKMDFFTPYVIGIDKMLEKGFVVFKIMWNYSTNVYTETINLEEMQPQVLQILFDASVTDDQLAQLMVMQFKPDMTIEENVEAIQKAVKDFRSGKTKINIDFHEKEHDEAQMIACDPKEDIVVPIDTTDINDAQFIDYKFWVTKNQLMTAMRDEKYEEYPEEEVEAWYSDKIPSSRYMNSIRDGVSNQGMADMILLHETCAWYDVNDDGIEERCIITYPDSDPSSILRFIELPYEHGMWPYVQVRRELNDTWFYSPRGIPALDDDFQTGISTKFNQDIDTQTIVNTPQVVYKRNSVFNKSNLRYVPGEPVEVSDPSDYEVRQNANLSQGNFLTSAQYLKSWANERVPNIASSLSQANNLPGQGQQGQKTKAEVDTVSLSVSQAQSLDLLIFQEQMKTVYYQIDSLWEQFGSEEEEIVMTGEQPVRLSRYEIQGKFHIVPNGKLENSNPVLKAQRSFSLLRMFLGDPDVRQYELKKLYFDDVDTRISKKLLMSQEEIAQRDQQMMMQHEMTKAKAVQEGTGLKRLQNMLELEKEAALAVIQGRKFAPE